ncbi:ferric reductase-like transmembrane domain-containing protein [Spongisporangium articulatum]|uniref:Ferric reductase-like transmembrane domain-containing protein n=1 Tax=Spongisporangium articulatum TaxID=3362603 RepID=A0ABW8APB2_9ACTN
MLATLTHRIARLTVGTLVPVALLVPLALSVDAAPTGRPFLELGLTTGVLAASCLLLTVLAASRIRFLSKAFGIDTVLAGHRWLGGATLALVLAHVALVVADDPGRNVGLLLVVDAPARARAATVATACLLLIWLSTLLRRRLRIRYEWWRAVHAVLTAGALVLTGLHVWWLRHLIQDPAMRAWYFATSGLLLAVLTNRWLLRPLRGARFDYVVERLYRESPDVWTVALRPRHPWRRGLRFQPGQFAWISVAGRTSRWDDHPFSIASSAAARRRLEFTIRDAGDFTHGVGGLAPGTRVRVDGPHGSFTAGAPRAPHLLLVAGGVGITPMMSMLRTLSSREERLPGLLVVAARHEHDLLFRDELAWLARRLGLEVVEVLSAPGPGWRGPTGRVDAALLASLIRTRRRRIGLEVHVCGPDGMVTAVRGAAEQLGVPAARVHAEQFSAV